MASRSPATISDVRDDLAMSDDDCPMEDSLNSSIESPSPTATTTRYREAVPDQGSAGKRGRPSSPDNDDTERDPKRTMLPPGVLGRLCSHTATTRSDPLPRGRVSPSRRYLPKGKCMRARLTFLGLAKMREPWVERSRK